MHEDPAAYLLDTLYLRQDPRLQSICAAVRLFSKLRIVPVLRAPTGVEMTRARAIAIAEAEARRTQLVLAAGLLLLPALLLLLISP